jgi:hypothetical protein
MLDRRDVGMSVDDQHTTFDFEPQEAKTNLTLLPVALPDAVAALPHPLRIDTTFQDDGRRRCESPLHEVAAGGN